MKIAYSKVFFLLFLFIFTDHCSKGDNKQNTRNIPLMRPFQFLQFTYMQITSCNLNEYSNNTHKFLFMHKINYAIISSVKNKINIT